jgi:hypothetical protein
VPNLVTSTHGSVNGDFKPLPAKRQDAPIPVDMQRFRLYTGRAVRRFQVDPYRDTDVIEWRDRVRRGGGAELLEQGQVSAAAGRPAPSRGDAPDCSATQELSGSGIREVYKDSYYRVYHLHND